MTNDNIKVMLISADPTKAIGGIATWTKGYLDYCKKENILCELIDTAKISRYHCIVINEMVRTYSIILRLKKKTVSGIHYDIAHLNSSIGLYGIIRDYILAWIIKKRKIPLVVHFHCDVQYWDKRKIVRYFLRKLLKLTDCCVVLCDSSKEHLYRRYNKKSVTVPNFTELDNIQDSRKQNSNIKTIIYTGRVSEAKGCMEIFKLARRFPGKVFLLVGKNFMDLSNVDISSNVRIIGEKEHDEVLELLDGADVFLFPSHSEGFSIALTEAMSKGLPSIATDVGANRDMLIDGAGIVVPIGDVDMMESALLLMEDQAIRQKMSEVALRKVKKEYAMDYVLGKMFELYQGVIKNENR